MRERESLLKTSAQQETIRQLMGEIDNIHAAWAWAIDHNEFDRIRQAGRAYGWYFEFTGLHQRELNNLNTLVPDPESHTTRPEDLPDFGTRPYKPGIVLLPERRP